MGIQDVDPLTGALAASGLAFIGGLGSFFYDPLILLALPLAAIVVGVVASATTQTMRDLLK